jgi:hypothetical protein
MKNCLVGLQNTNLDKIPQEHLNTNANTSTSIIPILKVATVRLQFAVIGPSTTHRGPLPAVKPL